jgi:hypothetical protein
VPTFSIVAEQRHEFAGDVEASVHQVAIELPGELTDADREALGSRIELLARSWASDCVTRRHVEL